MNEKRKVIFKVIMKSFKFYLINQADCLIGHIASDQKLDNKSITVVMKALTVSQLEPTGVTGGFGF